MTFTKTSFMSFLDLTDWSSVGKNLVLSLLISGLEDDKFPLLFQDIPIVGTRSRPKLTSPKPAPGHAERQEVL